MFICLLLTIFHSNHHLLHSETEIFGIQNPPGTEITLMPEPVRVAGAIPDTNIFNTSSEGDGIATGKYQYFVCMILFDIFNVVIVFLKIIII
jgi:hypothetical protein